MMVHGKRAERCKKINRWLKTVSVSVSVEFRMKIKVSAMRALNEVSENCLMQRLLWYSLREFEEKDKKSNACYMRYPLFYIKSVVVKGKFNAMWL